VRLNPAVEEAPGYPFLRVAEARRAAQARGVDVVDLSLGQPTDPAPQAVRDALALAAATLALCEYPSTEGLPELREAIAAWIARRFGVALDPARELLPTLGAKEPIALLTYTCWTREAHTGRVTPSRSPALPVALPPVALPARPSR